MKATLFEKQKKIGYKMLLSISLLLSPSPTKYLRFPRLEYIYFALLPSTHNYETKQNALHFHHHRYRFSSRHLGHGAGPALLHPVRLVLHPMIPKESSY